MPLKNALSYSIFKSLSKPDITRISFMLSFTLMTNGIFSGFNFFAVTIKTLKPALEMYSKSVKSIINESNLPISSIISFSKSGEEIVSIVSLTVIVNSFSLYCFNFSIRIGKR